jgi:hypothetical protein
MNRRLKTASHLERMVLQEMRRHAICDGVSAVTVQETADGGSWEVIDIHAPGGVVSAACRSIALAAAEELRKSYDLLPEHQLVPDYDLRME